MSRNLCVVLLVVGVCSAATWWWNATSLAGVSEVSVYLPPSSSDAKLPVAVLKKKMTDAFFLHVCKTGGISLLKMIHRDYGTIKKRAARWNCDYSADKEKKNERKSRCTIMQSEIHFSYALRSEFRFIFTMVRKPAHQVLSMYNHCKEARYRRQYRHLLPSVGVWLNHWFDQMHKGHWETVQFDSHFKCYIPINFQSLYLGSPENLTVLQQRFDVVGLTEEMERTSCLASILMLEGRVPDRCQRNICAQQTVVVDREDHGLTHHGDNTTVTNHEENLIQALTRQDERLYVNAKEAFRRQVQDMEFEYDFTMC